MNEWRYIQVLEANLVLDELDRAQAALHKRADDKAKTRS